MNKIINIFSFIVIVILILLLCKSCNDSKDQIKLFDSISDSLHTERNSLGQQKAYIQVIEANSAKQFLALKSKDSSVISLQRLVEKYKNKLQSATIFSTTTSISDSGITDLAIPKDTVKKGNISYIYPEYIDTLKNIWYNVILKVSKNSSRANIKVFNKFELTQTLEKQKGFFGFMKPKVPIASILNLNPYTITTELKTFTVSCECHNMRWFVLGNTTGLVGSVLFSNFLRK